jgi:signal transduction histidine kinase
MDGGNVELETELGAPPPVLARPAELTTAVMNLVVNAFEAMPGGGRITIRTGAEDGRSWLSVEDTGPGMPPDVEQRVFEPFFTTKGDLGTGLGLAMVYACVTRHAGTISLTTAPGKGAKFLLQFPAAVGARRE